MTDPSFDIPQYFVADVADAAGVDTMTLQNWIKRGAITFSEHDREGKGSGSRHLFTMRTALQIAITAELVRNGLTPQRANENASSTSFVSGWDKKTVGRTVTIDGQKIRVQEAEAERPRYLGISSDGESTLEFIGGADVSLDDLFLGRGGNPHQVNFSSIIIIALSKIAARVRDRLAARQ